MLTIKTDGDGKVWAEDARGDVVGLIYLTTEQNDQDGIEAVVAHARFAAERHSVEA